VRSLHKFHRRMKCSIQWKQGNTVAPGAKQSPERNAGNEEQKDNGSKLTQFTLSERISLQRIFFVNGIEFQNLYRSVKLRFTYVGCPSLRKYLSKLQRMLDYIDDVSDCDSLLSRQARISRVREIS